MQVEINYLNNNGVGVTLKEGKKIFIPYTIPGEIVEIEIIEEKNKYIKAKIKQIIKPSPQRVIAPCKYYTKCGGCSLQHMNTIAYEQFKIKLYHEAIANIGFSTKQLPIIIGPYTRRRTTLKAKIENNLVKLGYYKANSHELIHVNHCLILEKELNDLFQILYQMLENFNPLILAKTGIEIALTLCDNGIDLTIKSDHPPGTQERKELIKLTKNSKIIRIYWQASTNIEIVTKVIPIIKFSEKEVAIPPNTFLQVSKISQQIMVDFILKNIAPNSKVVDLYAGCGTYSIPIANQTKVHAVEGNSVMSKALINISKNLSTEHRDLYNHPLKIKELNNYDTIIINPPRNGAEKQIKSIAKSSVNNVILVSCDLNSFVRDAKILQQSGFRLIDSLAIDQFYYTAHLEIIAIFRK